MTDIRLCYQAIKWAIAEQVDISNLSLGFRSISSGNTLAKVRDALREAQENTIVVFAAISNEGTHQPIAWPASDSRYAIGIHSCNDSGTRSSSFAAPPSKNGANFMVVGKGILSQRVTARGGGFKVVEGSSYATPVASAIGALVLTYIRQHARKKEREKAEEQLGSGVLDEARNNHGMIKILEAISKEVESRYRSLPSTLFWGHGNFRDEQEAKDHAWRIITKALSLQGY